MRVKLETLASWFWVLLLAVIIGYCTVQNRQQRNEELARLAAATPTQTATPTVTPTPFPSLEARLAWDDGYEVGFEEGYEAALDECWETVHDMEYPDYEPEEIPY